MKISFAPKIPACDALCIFVPETGFSPKKYHPALPKSLISALSAQRRSKDFAAKVGEVVRLTDAFRGVPGKKVFFIGLGKSSEGRDVRKAAVSAMRAAKKAKASTTAFCFPQQTDPLRIASGAVLGNYEFKLGDVSEQQKMQKVFLVLGAVSAAEKKSIHAEVAAAEATNLTRELVNLPTNYATIDFLVSQAEQIAKKAGKKMKITVLDQKKIEKEKMGGVLGVAQGSDQEPRVVLLEYAGASAKTPPTALVGKGVVFDSGGYNLKPTKHIETMHQDMGGAATVLGVFDWLAQQKPSVNVIGVLGLVENSISGHAYRPGDILTLRNGKTVHITNTDAEGRLVLADCVHYVGTKKTPKTLLTVATLTGAVMHALGTQITGIVGNKSSLAKRFSAAAESADESVWELPLTDLFREKVKDEQADLQNWTAEVHAGCSMGAAFVEAFLPPKIDWLHVDIAGTAFQDKPEDDLSPKGGTGVMVRSLCRYFSS
ncbi:MAG: leucyl aminopeptidase family protein [Candidatus Gracilibacteria bacterium]|nr:leucyl aminopeptidase family protein [Candidatus Gracilibacteria bacterium]